MWRRLADAVAQFGWRAGPLYLLGRLLGALSPKLALHAYDLMVQPVSGKPLLSDAAAGKLQLVEWLPGDADLARLPVPPAVVAQRFAQGARCLAVFRAGALIGYLWFAKGCYLEDEVRCDFELHPADTSVFDFDVYVFPEYRMGRAFVGLWHMANQALRAQGVRRTFSRVNRFNLASRRSHAQLGATRIGRAVFLRAGRLELMAATVAPYLAATLGQRRVRVGLAAPDDGPAGG